jgi:beta-fructofuranosidase
VDNSRATIVQAKTTDPNLLNWGEKKMIISNAPSGLSGDFRDPYYFEVNGQKYVIVGASKNNIGACTLHKFNGSMWSNDGTIFFQGTSQSQHGTFWEMPNLTPMDNGKWLFTCTPLGTSVGVRTLCWVGTIGADGKFTPDGGVAGMQFLEMNGINRDGYGLLSPSICQYMGKTLLIGEVPDKLPTIENYKMGWAHNFSLPREISLAADGSLIQKPYSGLTGMRTATTVSIEQTLTGSKSLAPVSGRQIELLGEFTVGNGACGFHFLKKNDKQATLSYDPSTGMLTLDYTTLARFSNDNGTWSAKLPKKVNAGETLKLDVYFDGSIADIFVNDTWAFCVRIFPTDADAIEAEVFSDASATVKVNAWTLDAQQGQGTGIHEALMLNSEVIQNNKVYDLQGRRLNGVPQKGLYIMNGKKYVCR